jgi:heat shock protein HslJ
VYFNVLPPGSETALVNSSITGNQPWSGTLPADGDYTVRVYLMRAAARQGVKADHTLKVAILPARPEGRSSLSGTSWRLVDIKSMDDRIFTPDDRSKYTIAFGADGTASIRADCNRGRAPWSSAGENQLRFGALAATRAACPPGSLHDRFVRDMPYVRCYILKDGKLYLSLYADGGIYEFEPVPG